MIKIFFVFLTILLFVTTDLQHSFFTNSSIKSIDIENDTEKSRTIRVFFVISFVLDITILGLIIGIPLFFILWAVEYIIFGSINPFYVFKKQELNND